MQIQRAEPSDAAAVALVHVRSWQTAYRGLMPQDYLDGLDVDRRRRGWNRILTGDEWPRSGTLMAVGDEGVMGFANWCPTRDDDGDPATVGELAAIYLLPDAWGAGIGRRLLATSLDALVEAGYRQATLWVLATNDRARRFYEAGGWLPDGKVKEEALHGVWVTEVRYQRALR